MGRLGSVRWQLALMLVVSLVWVLVLMGPLRLLLRCCAAWAPVLLHAHLPQHLRQQSDRRLQPRIIRRVWCQAKRCAGRAPRGLLLMGHKLPLPLPRAARLLGLLCLRVRVHGAPVLLLLGLCLQLVASAAAQRAAVGFAGLQDRCRGGASLCSTAQWWRLRACPCCWSLLLPRRPLPHTCRPAGCVRCWYSCMCCCRWQQVCTWAVLLSPSCVGRALLGAGAAAACPWSNAASADASILLGHVIAAAVGGLPLLCTLLPPRVRCPCCGKEGGKLCIASFIRHRGCTSCLLHARRKGGSLTRRTAPRRDRLERRRATRKGAAHARGAAPADAASKVVAN